MRAPFVRPSLRTASAPSRGDGVGIGRRAAEVVFQRLLPWAQLDAETGGGDVGERRVERLAVGSAELGLRRGLDPGTLQTGQSENLVGPLPARTAAAVR